MIVTAIGGQQYQFPMYSAFSAAFTPAAAPTDVFLIQGATGTTVKVWRMFISTIQTTAGVNTWFINKHSSSNSGGTAVSSSRIPHFSGYPGALAGVNHYTANPTPGTNLGAVWSGFVEAAAAATAGTNGYVGVEVDFMRQNGSPIILQSSQGLALNFNGAALPPGLSVIAGITWSEEN